ncbi:hypothetical protein AVEN_211109-1 [Araneus ventricosus]|uniref:Uncharacterized protein n=1 Tax=Araneus ventricosus TaxID=182803 RepID=A0A4Y2TYE1_ARAVE|nr:hypothetical protein AVEN_41250-1 [Araneus ventricosus]GBO05183.1 hypothetical protein AVEN_211109-1 [Araneus ventricosus]
MILRYPCVSISSAGVNARFIPGTPSDSSPNPNPRCFRNRPLVKMSRSSATWKKWLCYAESVPVLHHHNTRHGFFTRQSWGGGEEISNEKKEEKISSSSATPLPFSGRILPGHEGPLLLGRPALHLGFYGESSPEGGFVRRRGCL